MGTMHTAYIEMIGVGAPLTMQFQALSANLLATLRSMFRFR